MGYTCIHFEVWRGRAAQDVSHDVRGHRSGELQSSSVDEGARGAETGVGMARVMPDAVSAVSVL